MSSLKNERLLRPRNSRCCGPPCERLNSMPFSRTWVRVGLTYSVFGARPDAHASNALRDALAAVRGALGRIS